jgi:hypothetical protein
MVRHHGVRENAHGEASPGVVQHTPEHVIVVGVEEQHGSPTGAIQHMMRDSCSTDASASGH